MTRWTQMAWLPHPKTKCDTVYDRLQQQSCRQYQLARIHRLVLAGGLDRSQR